MWAAKDRAQFSASMKRVAAEITSTFATSYTAEVCENHLSHMFLAQMCMCMFAICPGCVGTKSIILLASCATGNCLRFLAGGNGSGCDAAGADGVREAGDGKEVPAEPPAN